MEEEDEDSVEIYIQECKVAFYKSPVKKKKKLSHQKLVTNYSQCIICQTSYVEDSEDEQEVLYNVQSVEQLYQALELRQDSVTSRLFNDVQSNGWLRKHNPKWHVECRNVYTQEKLYKLAGKTQAQPNSQIGPNVTSNTCSSTDGACVLCGKRRYQGKFPSLHAAYIRKTRSLLNQASSLGRADILQRLKQINPEQAIYYHRICMNRFQSSRAQTTSHVPHLTVYDTAFTRITKHIDQILFQEKNGIMMKELNNVYNNLLQEFHVDQGQKHSGLYRSKRLQKRILDFYGDRVTIHDSSDGTGFLCASNLPLGDAMSWLYKIQNQVRDKTSTLSDAAKLLRKDAQQCKTGLNGISMTISHEGAYEIIPDSFFNFCCSLLQDQPQHPPAGSTRVSVERQIEEKAVILAQQIIHHVTPVNTPLSIGTAYYLYNHTRSKALVTFNNKLHGGISYDVLNRQLTAECEDIQMEILETGLFVPKHIKPNMHHPPVYAADNLDWKRKSIEGGSFNATTSVIIQNIYDIDDPIDKSCTVSIKTSKHRTPEIIPESPRKPCHVSKQERKQSRSVQQIKSLSELQTDVGDGADDVLLLWQLCRLHNSQLWDTDKSHVSVPNFNAFCSGIFPRRPSSLFGYLPLIPESPTDPSVLRGVMANLVKINKSLGHDWTIIAGDQATYDLASAIRKKDPTFNKVVLLLGSFHLEFNYLRAICRIIQGAGGETLLAKAGIFSEGTSNKVLGEKGDFYQTMYAINLLSEAIHGLYYDAFEEWFTKSNASIDWIEGIQNVLDRLRTNQVIHSNLEDTLSSIAINLATFRRHQVSFENSLKSLPSAQLWLTFMKMTSNLHRFIFHEREGNWTGHLSEAAKMLPFLTAAGHFKYGQESLPLYIKEMKQLPATAPKVHDAMMAGGFVGRRRDGAHNSVSADMLLEQTYNAQAKEGSGLDGITLNEATRAKWVLTKPTTAAISSQLGDMLHVTPSTEHHHDSSAHIKSIPLVSKVQAAVEINPFVTNTKHLINISTGVIADAVVKHDLTQVESIGLNALKETLGNSPSQRRKVKVNTFHKQLASSNRLPKKPKNSDEITALLRITKLVACGNSVDIVNIIGQHECSDAPPSLFTTEGMMRNPGTKSSLVRALIKESGVEVVSEIVKDRGRTAVIIDAMHMIHKWSFQKGEPYTDIASRYKANLLADIPIGTMSIHFCCDTYHVMSLKSGERQQRAANKSLKSYEVRDGFFAPDPSSFFAVSVNKTNLLKYICEKWSEEPMINGPNLYLSGGFTDTLTTVCVTENGIYPVPSLMSTHEEADQRIILHTLYAIEKDHSQSVVIHCNDTDVVCLAIYYISKLDLQNVWIRTEYRKFLPIHHMSQKLGTELCSQLPFLHSIGGRDITSFLYGIGKGAWVTKSKEVSLNVIASYGEDGVLQNISQQMIGEATTLLKSVYGNKKADVNMSIAEIRAQKFLTSKSTLLKILPPTEDAFKQHLQRAAYATLVDKSTHLPKPDLPPFVEYGWKVDNSSASISPQPTVASKN